MSRRTTAITGCNRGKPPPSVSYTGFSRFPLALPPINTVPGGCLSVGIHFPPPFPFRIQRSLPSIPSQEDDCPWKPLPPAPLPSRAPTGWFHHSYFIHIFYFAYITDTLLAHSKCGMIEICEIEIEKTLSCTSCQPLVIPLNAA